jgi:hypothetical protein
MNNNNMFPSLKKEVIEIIDRHPFLSPDNAFVAWFLRAFIVDNEEIAVNSLVGGPRDKGVDAIFIDHDSRAVFIIQGKYHQGDRIPSEKRSDVVALADIGRSLMLEQNSLFKSLVHDSDESVKKALHDSRSAIQRRNYRLNLQFVTTGKVSSTHKQEAEQKIEDWHTASYDSYSRADLLRLMQDYIEGAAPPTPTIHLPVMGQEVFKRKDNGSQITSWIFSMKGSDVGKLFNDMGIRLFARNIRGFLGNTVINKGMQNTLKNEPDFFWYYNNGITIVCDKANQIISNEGNQLRIANAQIINGQQTTRTLAQNNSDDAEVLVKLIEIPRDSSDGHRQYSQIVNEIVSATNWQNAIAQSDLRSNDSEQVRIEREFRKLNYQYLRKRMSKREARKLSGGRYKWVIKKEDLARSVGACVLDPYEVRMGRDRLFEDEVYFKIFDGKSGPEYLIYYWLDRIVSYWGRGDRRRGYARWLVLNFIWSHMGSFLKRPEMRERFIRIAERKWYHEWELQPLNIIANSSFSSAMAFFRANKRRGDSIQDESSFFKHKNLHREFEIFWRRKLRSKHKLFNKRVKNFKERLKDVEW